MAAGKVYRGGTQGVVKSFFWVAVTVGRKGEDYEQGMNKALSHSLL